MNNYIGLRKANCKNCYKCIRHCPVKSIKFSNNQAHIVEDECILCGMCFVACPQNAKEIRNEVEVAQEYIASGKPVYVSLAPSFIANYNETTFENMKEALLALGFTDVEETAIGATIVTDEYEKIVDDHSEGLFLTSCCPTVNTLIQKYYPEALPYLLPVDSPMAAHCKLMKQEHPDAYTVFIGPCISKKAEGQLYPGIVDCVLTFEELSQWMEKEAIVCQKGEISPDTKDGRARLYPTPGGILRTITEFKPEIDYIEINGMDNCKEVLENIKQQKLTHTFIEMSACSGSCIGGPAMSRGKTDIISDRKRVYRFAGTKPFKVKNLKQFILKKDFPFIGVHKQMPGSKAIEEILMKMGKRTHDMELNCGSCGYNTCREKAVAVYLGKADLTMCLPYLKEKAESFSDNIISNTPNGIIVINEELEVQQINKATCNILNINHASDILNAPVVRILDPIEYINVMATGTNIHDKRKYLAEYKKYVEETVIYDKKYHIIMILLRDITKEELERSKRESISQHTIEITDKVIEKQMRVVQEIASLLGETTAETKIALSNLKENLKNE